MAKSKLIKELANGKVDLVTAFNRLLIIASDIENEDLAMWVECELNGYQNFEDLPEYRIIQAPNLQYTGINGGYKITNMPLPHAYLYRETIDKIIDVGVFEGIKELEKYTYVKKPLYRDMTPLAGEVLERTGIRCVSIKQTINPEHYTGVLSSIQTKLIKVLLKIDKEYGNFDELDVAITDKTPDDLRTINIQIKKLIYGDNSIKIGDNNDINKSKIGMGE